MSSGPLATPDFPFLPLLPEVWQSQALGRLAFTPVAQADHNQHQDSDQVGEHLVDLLDSQVGPCRDKEVKDIKSAEKHGSKDTYIGAPDGEDDEGDGQTSPVAETVVGPDAGGVVHDIIETAQAGNHAADAGSHILIPGNIDACCIGCSRALTDSAQVQADPGAFQDISSDKGDDDTGISQKAVGQEHLPEIAGTFGKGQGPGKALAGG